MVKTEPPNNASHNDVVYKNVTTTLNKDLL
jgi:hypothetical protein